MKNDFDTLIKQHVKLCEAEVLIKKFKLKETGSSDGTNNKPDTNATLMSPVEIELQAYVSAIATKSYNAYDKEIRKIISERDNITNSINIDQDIEAISNTEDTHKPHIEVECAQHKAQIMNAANYLGRMERSFSKFKIDNGLTHVEPRYPENKIKHIQWVGIGAIIELILAIPFYNEVANNLISAIGLGFLVVTLNILLAYIAGDRLRFFNHVNINKKITFTSLGVAMLGMFIAAILMAGHLRTAIINIVSANEGNDSYNPLSLIFEAGKQAWVSFKESPFALGGDVVPIMFLFASFGFGIVVMWKAYTSDDEYPGYGPIDRQRKAAFMELNQKRRDMFTSLDEKFKSSASTTKNSFNSSKTKCEQVISNIADHRSLLNQANNHINTLNNNLNASAQTYRAANEYVRNIPKPDYFQSELTLSGINTSELPQVASSDEELENTLQDKVQELTDAYNKTIQAIKIQQKNLYTNLNNEIDEAIRLSKQ